MKKFDIFLILIFTFFIGCNSKTTTDKTICPQCRMPIKSKINTARMDNIYFDDVGCLILWAKKEAKKLNHAEVFTKDTHKYINATDAYYSNNERTPMGYGFTAYEHQKKGYIKFEEMRLKMLRGENLHNPKIRKRILGE